MANTHQGGPLTALYAVPMHEAIASGDLSKMSAIRDQALGFLSAAADIERLLPAVDNAIKARGGPVRTLYGVTIQDALARGDQGELARLKAEVAYYSRILS